MIEMVNDKEVKQEEVKTEEVKTEVKQEPQKQLKGIIGLPHTGNFPWQTVMSILSLRMPENSLVKYHLIGSCLVYDARDKVIEFAMKEDADWIFFLDSDMEIPCDTLQKLVALNVPIASGMAFKRTPPFQPCFYTKVEINKETHKPYLESPIDFPDTGIIECQGVGMACCLIRREVWENCAENISERIKTWFFPYPGIGEDLSFCLRARKKGFKMYADLSINTGHVSQMQVKKEHFIFARDEHMKNNPNEPLFREE